MKRSRRVRTRSHFAISVSLAILAGAGSLLFPCRRAMADDPTAVGPTSATKTSAAAVSAHVNRPSETKTPVAPSLSLPALNPTDTMRTLQNVAIFGLISLAPMALLMVTAFVRINVVLILLRQALGSPQVPGNQILTALALLLTALVMHPIGQRVYQEAVLPYSAGQLSAPVAWKVGTQPIKTFMVNQIERTNHQDYLKSLNEYATSHSPGQVGLNPVDPEDLPLRVVAPAYLLSELTTALLMGFYVYLPFLVIDLVVSAVLAATGLFMLPPALVATPIKLIVFVLADGWLMIASMLLASFATAPGGP